MPEQDPTPPQKSPTKTLADFVAEKSGVLKSSESVKSAGDKLRELNADSLPVCEDHRLVGTINDRHPDRTAARFGHDPQEQTVGQSMSREISFCYEDQSENEAREIMLKKGLRYLPVVDRSMRIIGMISLEELSAAAE